MMPTAVQSTQFYLDADRQSTHVVNTVADEHIMVLFTSTECQRVNQQ